MKMNLRKAAAIQSAIRSFLREQRIRSQVEINEFSQDVPGELRRARLEYAEDLALHSALIDALFEIRNKVAGANARSGVNKILAEVEKLRMHATVASVLGYSREARPVGEIEAEMLKASKQNNQYGRLEKYAADFGVMSREEIEEHEDEARKLQRDAKALEDSLLGINVSEEISVSDDAARALEKARII